MQNADSKVGGPLALGGVLLTTFAGQLPDFIQKIGLIAGLVLTALGLFLLGRDWLAKRRGRPKAPKTFGKPPAAVQADFPDWTIRELFFHIRPDVLDGKDGVAVGSEVMDAFSLGRLRCWGREIDQRRRRLPQAEIPTSYWRHADFTYWFLKDGDGVSTQVTGTGSPISGPEYTDLRVNKAEALAIWP